MGKGLQRTVLAALFLVGLAVFCYPYAQGLLVKREMESTVQTFQEQKETQPTTSVVIPDSTQPSEQRLYPELWADMAGDYEIITFVSLPSGCSRMGSRPFLCVRPCPINASALWNPQEK